MKFPTGGKAREPLMRYDLVKFQSRRYSPDKRRVICILTPDNVILSGLFFGDDFLKKVNLRGIVASALLGAIGFILMMVEFPVPIIPSFIKLDFSELPALIAAFAFGPLYGVLVCFVKNALHLFITSTVGVGELANFLLGVFFVGTAGLIYQRHKNRTGALVGSLTGSAVMGVACVFVNYFITYPFYYKAFMSEAVVLSMYQDILPSVDSILESLLIFNLPFTFAKGVAVSVICFLIYKKISPILKKN